MQFCASKRHEILKYLLVNIMVFMYVGLVSRLQHASANHPGDSLLHPNRHPNQGFIRVHDIYCFCANWL